MRAAWAALVALSACYSPDLRSPGADPDGGAGRDGSGAGDASPPADAFLLQGGWGAPFVVTGVNSENDDDDPSLTGDLTELYFSSRRPGSFGGKEIWVAKRDNTTMDFSAPEEVPGINTVDDDDTPEISLDGLTLRFSRVDAGDTVGTSGAVYVATRPDRSSGWIVMATPDLDSPVLDQAAVVARGGARAYLCSRRPDDKGYDLFVAHRPSSDGLWSAASLQMELSSNDDECSPWVNDADTTILFHSDRGVTTSNDLWGSARSDPAEPWPAPQKLDELSTIEQDEDPWLSPDGRRLYFVRMQLGVGREIVWSQR